MFRRIVLTCWGSYGDLFPYLALAIRLKALGHEPVVATCAYYRSLVEREGVRFHPVRPDVDPDDAGTIRRIMDSARGTEVVVRELLVPAIRDAFRDLSEVVRDADLLVTHPVTFAGSLAAEVHGVRWVSSVLAPASMFSARDFPLLPPAEGLLRVLRTAPWAARGFMRLAKRITGPWTAPVRAFRCELGLEDRGDPLYEGQFSPRCTLALFSPLFGFLPSDWPPHAQATGFVLHQSGAALPDALKAFLQQGEPPIVFTLGSSAVGAAGDFYQESAKAAATIGRRAVLLVGRDPRNRTIDLPPTMVAAEYAPHHLLFPRAAAVVHHGGVGTMAQALAAGRPMLVVPHAHDQPDNAFRAQRLGVARVLGARAYSAARVARHLRALLAGPGYDRQAALVGSRLAGEDGIRTACEAILQQASPST